jgi:hypothetical protein
VIRHCRLIMDHRADLVALEYPDEFAQAHVAAP